MERSRRFFRNLTQLEQARELLLSRFASLATASEIVRVREALGRIVAGPIRARASVPAYHAAAMDGLAVRARSTFGAERERPVLLAPAGAVEINTGDPMPEGFDAVVMIENVEKAGGQWEIRAAVYPWQNVRKAGEDIVREEILLPARHRIQPHDQGALLAAGLLSIDVLERPRVLIVPTGDEIVQPEAAEHPLPAGAILEVNGQVLASMVEECGGRATLVDPVPDAGDPIQTAVRQGLADGFHLLLIIAGSSAGSTDHTPALLEGMGELLVHGVAVMPGKPTLLASVGDRPVIGIPGYPVSAVVAFRDLVRPLLYAMQGGRAPDGDRVEVTLARKLPSKLGLEEQVRVIIGQVDGKMVALPLGGGAGVLRSLVRADGIIRVPHQVSGWAEGETVAAELMVPREALAGKLLVIGSHDLTIDLLGSMIRERSAGRISISSSNVGSTGGLLAVARGVAHVAGSHLLDTETGDYNRSYVATYLADTPVTLVTLVHRWQGFMVARGNPKGIEGVRDLTKPDVTFVNRQAGSGTRILLDVELAKQNVSAEEIVGYRNDETTHMGVAVAVASGSADAGLGIAGAAQALDLDFLPVTQERYDLVIPQRLLDDEAIVLLLEIIRSPEFKEQVAALGGYVTDETGTVPHADAPA